MEYEKMGQIGQIQQIDKELNNFIRDTKSILFYKDKLQNILQGFYNAKKNKYNCKSIGKIFMATCLYAFNPDISIIEIEKQTDNLTELEKAHYRFLLDNMKMAMSTKLRNTNNGSKGGAPQGNNNAKKIKNPDTDKITDKKYLLKVIDTLTDQYPNRQDPEIFKDYLLEKFDKNIYFSKNEIIELIFKT